MGDASNASLPEEGLSEKIPSWRLITSQSNITQGILHGYYDGSGTAESPYAVQWLKNDPVNPLEYPAWKKWSITLIMALSTLCITYSSSGLAGADPQLIEYFEVNPLLVTADVSLFVLAFAIGPAVWGPLSEIYGRQIVFIISFAGVTIFSGAAIASPNIGALLALRFLSGAFGASTLTNAAGVISDLFVPRERGLAGITYVAAPFLGPTLGPITSSFLAQAKGWRPVAILIAVFALVSWLLGCLVVPETYAPVLLKRRAARLSRLTGRVYRSKVETENASMKASDFIYVTMTRPWVLLVREPIVLSLSIYMAIIYGTLYLSFAAFPIVFAGDRGWSQGMAGLSLLGIMVGEILGIIYAVLDTIRYKRVADRSPGGVAPPEAWLPPSLVGAVALPVGLFWFSWTNGRELHWIVCLVGIVPFGFGEVLVFLSVNQYLIDAYGVYAASCLATIAIVRALFGAAFPMFTTPMYEGLGIHWASSVPAFLALACLPFPILFYRYGLEIRRRCRYSADAMKIMDQIRGTERGQERMEVSQH